MTEKITEEERNFRQEAWDYLRTSLEAETTDLPEKISHIALSYIEGEVDFKTLKNVIIEVLEDLSGRNAGGDG